MPRFAAIGLDHRHVYDLTAGLLAAGADCAGHDSETSDPRVLAGFRKRFPNVPEVARERLLDDPSIDFIVLAAIPRDRAGLAIQAMRRGKDVVVDKPGVTTAEQLAAVEQAVRETGRIWSIGLGRLTSPAVQEALRIVRTGELGRLVHLTSLAPHRLNRALRPAWFFERPAYGGIINDIGVHSIDQFLAFAGAQNPNVAAATIDTDFAASSGIFDVASATVDLDVATATMDLDVATATMDLDVASATIGPDIAAATINPSVAAATIGCFGTEPTGFEDFAEIRMQAGGILGTMRLDWFTPDGLPDWGDGRLFLVGTEGTLELRKNLDIEGRPGGDHLFVANRRRTRHQDCSGLPVTYYQDFLSAIGMRDSGFMGNVFTVCRLALHCQATAVRFTP